MNSEEILTKEELDNFFKTYRKIKEKIYLVYDGQFRIDYDNKEFVLIHNFGRMERISIYELSKDNNLLIKENQERLEYKKKKEELNRRRELFQSKLNEYKNIKQLSQNLNELEKEIKESEFYREGIL